MTFKVFYDFIVTFYVHLNLDYHTYICFKECSCYLYSHYKYQHTCDVIAPNAPAKRWGIRVRSFCTLHLYLSIRLHVFHLKSQCPWCPRWSTSNNRIRPGGESFKHIHLAIPLFIYSSIPSLKIITHTHNQNHPHSYHPVRKASPTVLMVSHSMTCDSADLESST